MNEDNIVGIHWAIEKLRDLQNEFRHQSKWNHSGQSKFAQVELSDYLVLELRKEINTAKSE